MTGASGGGPPDLLRGVVQVLDGHGRTAGTGFLVADGLLVTCAHVIAGPGGAPPGGPVPVRFAHLDDQPRRAWALPEHWRAPDRGDVAFLRLADPAPALARPLPLGTSDGGARHPVKTFGFPANAPGGGHYGYGLAGDPIHGDNGVELLQLSEATEITQGFSGGPVVDERSGLVIGMVDSVAAPDRHGRGRSTAYITPVATLRAAHPGLAVADVCPYPGLRPFTTGDAAWFHGRDRALSAVLDRLRDDRAFLALLGPSGSGKSSLIHAGLRPALARAALPGSDRWGWVVARPGSDPVTQLAQAGLPGVEHGLADAARAWRAARPDHTRLVLVLDQFEELLVATAPQPRQTLLRELADLAEQDPAVTVVITMRDDFYSRLAAQAPDLMPLLQRGLVNIPAVLEPDDLTAIVERPATAVGLTLEPNLAARIVADAAQVTAPGTAGRASVTVLPLLSSALAELWRRCRGPGRLTHHAYAELGGVAGWLDRWCDHAYTEVCHTLPGDRRPLVRQVLLALVRPGDDAANVPPTRQRRTLAQLGALGTATDAHDSAATVVGLLADRRLITTGQDPATGEPVVELAHEALLHEWALLRRWLADDHVFLAWRHDLAADHSRWQASTDRHGRPDADLLLPGSALDAARRWLHDRPTEIDPDLARYITLSNTAQQRRLTRDRRRVTVLSALLALAVLAGTVAAWQWNTARDQTALAQHRARLADSRTLATQALGVVGRQPDLALLLALQGLSATGSRQAWGALGTVMSRPIATSRILYGSDHRIETSAFRPDGKVFVTANQVSLNKGTLRFWDAATGEQTAVLDEPRTESTLVYSPDGKWLASSGMDGTWLRDGTTGRPVGELLRPTNSFFPPLAFSPDSRLLAALSGDPGRVEIIDVATRRATGPAFEPKVGYIERIAFNSDAGEVAFAGPRTVRVYDVGTRRMTDQFKVGVGVTAMEYTRDGLLAVAAEDGLVYLVGPDHTLIGQPLRTTVKPTAITLRPGTNTLVSADAQGAIHQWDLKTRQSISTPLLGHVGRISGLVFSPDGATLASVGNNNQVRFWNLATGQPLGQPLVGHSRTVNSVAFSPDGATLLSGGFDESIRQWDLASRTPHGTPLSAPGEQFDPGEVVTGDPVGDARINPATGNLAAIRLGTQGAVRLWDPRSGRLISDHGPELVLALSPDGRLAAIDRDKTVVIRDVAAGKETVTLPTSASSAVFNHDGTRLTVGRIGAVEVWDLGTGRSIATGRPDEQHRFARVEPLALSRDGRTVVTGDPSNGLGDDGMSVWQIDGDELAEQQLTHRTPVTAAAFSPDGRLLAVGGADYAVQLFETETWQPVADPLALHQDTISSLAFSPDGKLVASGSKDGTIRLWAAPSTWIEHACALAGRNLSQAEWEQYAPPGGRYVRLCPQYPSGFEAPADAPAAAYPGSP
ncbi:nSTAND1 domain-containing NTPase [Catellatospora coxensis]|uniref:nSTAND1 domain-containing NTPase n=1 Tax=Catellatospora coxensis TaxID=310354 RepID=UPI0019422054|nr:trypsin-like peptidase domain-containing protein [Catellatospora coxensis]